MRKKPEYIFNKEIESKLTGFKTYLQELGNGANTIRQKSNYAEYFLKWLETEHLQPEETRYNDLLSFIDYCKLEVDALSGVEGNSKSTSTANYEASETFMNTSSNPTPLLLTQLQPESKRHPAKLPSNIIDYKELENLYQSFETTTNREKRNKIILGILVYQGVTTRAA